MRFWIPTMVFAVALAATLAFHGAMPALDRSPGPSATPRFAALTGDGVDSGMRAAAEIYRVRYETARARIAARRAAVAHLQALLGREVTPASVTDDTLRSQAHTLAGVEEVVDGLPAARTDLIGGRARPRGALPPREIDVLVRVQLRPMSPLARSNTIDWKTQVRMRLGAKGGWTARGGGVLGQPIYRDPHVAVRRRVLVVGPSSLASFVDAAADEANGALPEMRARYSLVAGPEQASLFVLDSARSTRKLLGAGHDSPPAHPAGWTYETGNVVLLWPRLASMGVTQRLGVVRHEIVHVATLPLMRHAPTLLVEGIATSEEAASVTAGNDFVLDLRPLRAAFRDGTLGYQQLLHSMDQDFDRTSQDEIDMAYMAGFATVGFVEDRFGHAALQRLLAQLRAGVKLDAALQRVLSITPEDLQRRARAWTAAYVDTHPVA